MRFAFVTDELPQSGMAGHLALNHAIISWLRSNGHHVTVLLLRPRLRGLVQHYDAAQVIGIGIWHWRGYVLARGLAGLGILGRSVLEILPAQPVHALRRRWRTRQYATADTVLGAFATPEQSAWCARRLINLAPDAVFIDTIFRTPVLAQPAAAQFRSVVIAHDLFYRRHRALRSAGYNVYPAELTREAEAGWLNMANAIAAIQPEEAAEFREMCPDSLVCTAPMPALPCRRPENIRRIPDRLVFVGSATLPNLDGLRWLFAEIWPHIKAARPAVTLDLVGDCGAALPVLPPGVKRLGRIDKLSPILHRAMLAISPLRVGSGLKIKILDYARHGLVTVATAESLAGFAADENAPFIPAQNAAGFAEAVLAGLVQGDGAGEAQALDYVTKHYNQNASFAGLAAILQLPEAAGCR